MLPNVHCHSIREDNMPCVNKIVPAKEEEKAIRFEVIQEDVITKKNGKPNSPKPNKTQTKWVKGNPSTCFTETVQLCCLKMTAGPGTTFGDYKIPDGATCSLCGSGIQKTRI